MINFAHIAPTRYLYLTNTNKCHLILSHLVDRDPDYRNYYANLNDGVVKILDNAGFEMYKQGKPMYPSSKLIDVGKSVGADYIVMSDYPNEPGKKTVEAAISLAPKFREAGFKTFFVPQSKIGDLQDYLNVFEWALKSSFVDMIGVSILGVPNAFGVEKDNKLQRYLSRYHLMTHLQSKGLLEQYIDNNTKKLHFLGMVDGPNEIELVKDFHPYIYSWDSSAGVWAGLNGITFDNSPTGLVNGKFEVEVDFNLTEVPGENIVKAVQNIRYINDLIENLSVEKFMCAEANYN